MEWSTRAAVPDDVLGLATLNSVVQDLHHRERPDWFKPADPQGFAPIVQGWLSSDASVVFIAEAVDGSALGYATGHRLDRPDHPLTYAASFVELDQVVVVPRARRTGIATALVRLVLAWADEQGVDRVELSTWAFNETACRTFEGIGFAHTSRRMSLNRAR